MVAAKLFMGAIEAISRYILLPVSLGAGEGTQSTTEPHAPYHMLFLRYFLY